MVAGMNIAAHTVLGCVKTYKFNARSFVQNVDCRLELIVDAGRIGEQTHALAFKRGKVHIAQNLDTGLYYGGCG